jgi:putative SOS response-associated peptidase YedK
MCGRYELHTHPAALALLFGLPHPPQIAPRYNIAPTQNVPVVRATRQGERELAQVRWGFVPRWAKDPSIGARLINARAETVADKPAFRTALRLHRCLLPSDGFYEWQVVPGAGKQPMHIGMKSGGPFAMAGLTERWLSPEGEVLDTCAIVTTQANALLAPLHDRMPLIIAPEDYARWLDRDEDDVGDLLRPYPAEAMACYPVSTRVNAVRNDDASIIDRAEPTVAPPAAEPEPELPLDAAHVPEQAKLF